MINPLAIAAWKRLLNAWSSSIRCGVERWRYDEALAMA
jgi:hypothetical protein